MVRLHADVVAGICIICLCLLFLTSLNVFSPQWPSTVWIYICRNPDDTVKHISELQYYFRSAFFCRHNFRILLLPETFFANANVSMLWEKWEIIVRLGNYLLLMLCRRMTSIRGKTVADRSKNGTNGPQQNNRQNMCWILFMSFATICHTNPKWHIYIWGAGEWSCYDDVRHAIIYYILISLVWVFGRTWKGDARRIKLLTHCQSQSEYKCCAQSTAKVTLCVCGKSGDKNRMPQKYTSCALRSCLISP